jgi:hypothetical protein
VRVRPDHGFVIGEDAVRNVALILALAATLAGCQKAEEAASDPGKAGARGRYVGVGIYAPGRLWAELAQPPPATPDAPAANLDDDDHVIVVVDTATGELRQCGNLSGHCLTSNPWAKTTSIQPAPAKLLKHLGDLRREDQAADEAADRAAKTPQK